MKQECIPVGGIPSAAVAIWGRVSLPRGRGCLPKGELGVSAKGGVCLGGVHLPCGQNDRCL